MVLGLSFYWKLPACTFLLCGLRSSLWPSELLAFLRPSGLTLCGYPFSFYLRPSVAFLFFHFDFSMIGEGSSRICLRSLCLWFLVILRYDICSFLYSVSLECHGWGEFLFVLGLSVLMPLLTLGMGDSVVIQLTTPSSSTEPSCNILLLLGLSLHPRSVFSNGEPLALLSVPASIGVEIWLIRGLPLRFVCCLLFSASVIDHFAYFGFLWCNGIGSCIAT